MKEYKRLTERRETPLVMSQWGGTSRELKIYNRLAELEDKIENGTLIELPCKVGDRVYVLNRKNNLIEMDIFDYTVNIKGFVFEAANEDLLTKYYLYDFDFNKDWFLTKAEAEAKLKDLQGDK